MPLFLSLLPGGGGLPAAMRLSAPSGPARSKPRFSGPGPQSSSRAPGSVPYAKLLAMLVLHHAQHHQDHEAVPKHRHEERRIDVAQKLDDVVTRSQLRSMKSW